MQAANITSRKIMTDKEKFMKHALRQARKAEKAEEVPIGCVIVKDGKVFTRAYNMRQTKRLATAHAEILAIEKACRKIKDWRLDGMEMYVTLEPCAMCAGAIANSRIYSILFLTFLLISIALIIQLIANFTTNQKKCNSRQNFYLK